MDYDVDCGILELDIFFFQTYEKRRLYFVLDNRSSLVVLGEGIY